MTTLAIRSIHWARLWMSVGLSVAFTALLAAGLDRIHLGVTSQGSPLLSGCLVTSVPTGCPSGPAWQDQTSTRDTCPLHGARLVRTETRFFRATFHHRSVPREVEIEQFPFAVPTRPPGSWFRWSHGIRVIYSRCPDCADARQAWLSEHPLGRSSLPGYPPKEKDLRELSLPVKAPAASVSPLPPGLVDPLLTPEP